MTLNAVRVVRYIRAAEADASADPWTGPLAPMAVGSVDLNSCLGHRSPGTSTRGAGLCRAITGLYVVGNAAGYTASLAAAALSGLVAGQAIADHSPVPSVR